MLGGFHRPLRKQPQKPGAGRTSPGLSLNQVPWGGALQICWKRKTVCLFFLKLHNVSESGAFD